MINGIELVPNRDLPTLWLKGTDPLSPMTNLLYCLSPRLLLFISTLSTSNSDRYPTRPESNFKIRKLVIVSERGGMKILEK